MPGQRWLGWVAVWLCLAGLPLLGQAPAVDERAERYLDGYMMYNEGERLEKAAQLEEALGKFRDAAKIFESLAQNHPGWETNMIGMRLRKVQDSIGRVQTVMQRPPVAAAQAEGPLEVTAPTDGPPVMTTVGPVDGKGMNTPPEVGKWGAGLADGAPAGAGQMPSLTDFFRQYEQQVKEKVESLQRKNLEMEGALRKWDEWYRWASGEIQTARTEKATLAGRMTEMEKRVQQMQREVEAGKASRGQLDTLLKEKAALLALEKQNDQRLAKAESAAAEAAQKVTATSTEVAALARERDQLKAERDAAMKEREEQISARQKLEAELAEAKKGDKGEALIRLAAENERLKGENEGMKKQVATLQKDNTGYQTQVSELTVQLQALQTSMAKAGPGAPKDSENEMLRTVILRQLRNQARQQPVKAVVIEELQKLEGASPELIQKVDGLDAGRLTLTADEEKLFTDPQAQELLRAGSGAVQATLIASGGEEGKPMAKPAGEAPGANPVPVQAATLLAKAEAGLRAKNYAEAIKAFNEVLRDDPKNGVALTGLGDAYQRTGKFAEAEVALKKCLSYEPTNAPAYYLLGMTYFRNNRLNEAMSAFEDSLKHNAKQEMVHHYLGIIASRMKQGQRAEQEFRAALAINPKFGEAHFNLAVLYASWDPPQWDKARTEYQSAVGKGVLPDSNLEKLLKQ
jgi:tetratricopeptide (TPR) repeat protein